MFKIKENELINHSRVTYEDEFKNTALVIKKNTGFTLKTRFFNEQVKARPLYVSINSGEPGINMHIDFPEGARYDPTVVGGIENTKELLNRWNGIMEAIRLLDVPPQLIAQANGVEITEKMIEEISRRKFEVFSEYDELKNITDSMKGI